jgi:hypothetical protein
LREWDARRYLGATSAPSKPLSLRERGWVRVRPERCSGVYRPLSVSLPEGEKISWIPAWLSEVERISDAKMLLCNESVMGERERIDTLRCGCAR